LDFNVRKKSRSFGGTPKYSLQNVAVSAKVNSSAKFSLGYGRVEIKYRVIMKKLVFLHHLKRLDDSTLANQVMMVQYRLQLPGLVTECMQYIHDYKLPNIMKVNMSEREWKTNVKNCIREANSKELRTET
jgi:hypothetical protein